MEQQGKQKDNCLKLVVIFHRLGPYHHARLSAAAAQGPVTAVEMSSDDKTYAWQREDKSCIFKQLTLFEEGDVVDLPNAVVLHRLYDTLTGVCPDVLVIPGWGSHYALAALLWCKRNGIRSVLMSASSYHDARRHSLTEWIKRQIVPLFDAALVGGQLQKEYVAFLGLPRERIFAGYDVVDNAYFSQKSEIARQQEASLRQALQLPNPFFLASGRFVVKKNFTNLIEAYARYRHLSKGSPWDLVLLGDGPSRNEITATIHQFGMSGVVHMPGFIQYDSLPDYYGLASAFVHASTTEQWGLVVNEAMASGLPVLLSKACGCVPDLVEEGKNGFTFDPLDQGQLALLMLRMANGDANLEVMGNASREIILRWAPETFADNLWQAARLALQVPGRRTPILSHLILNSLVHWFGKALPSHS